MRTKSVDRRRGISRMRKMEVKLKEAGICQELTANIITVRICCPKIYHVFFELKTNEN